MQLSAPPLSSCCGDHDGRRMALPFGVSKSTALCVEIDGNTVQPQKQNRKQNVLCPTIRFLERVMRNAQTCVPPLPPVDASLKILAAITKFFRNKLSSLLNRPLTQERFRFLCHETLTLLFIEIAILLSIGVTYSCSFFSVAVVDDKDKSYIFETGLFRYSVHQASSSHFKCREYSRDYGYENPLMTEWLGKTTSMVGTARMCSIVAPILAVLACIHIVLEVFKPTIFQGAWLTSISVFSAGLCQAVGNAAFDEERACNAYGLLPEHSIQECTRSTGSSAATVATVSYFLLSILIFYIPRKEDPKMRLSKSTCMCCSLTNTESEQIFQATEKNLPNDVDTIVANEGSVEEISEISSYHGEALFHICRSLGDLMHMVDSPTIGSNTVAGQEGSVEDYEDKSTHRKLTFLSYFRDLQTLLVGLLASNSITVAGQEVSVDDNEEKTTYKKETAHSNMLDFQSVDTSMQCVSLSPSDNNTVAAQDGSVEDGEEELIYQDEAFTCMMDSQSVETSMQCVSLSPSDNNTVAAQDGSVEDGEEELIYQEEAFTYMMNSLSVETSIQGVGFLPGDIYMVAAQDGSVEDYE